MEFSQLELTRLAAVLQSLQPSPNATFFYDLLSDALIWSDEIPVLGEEYRTRDLWYLRPIFRYRSSLIENEPDVRCEASWKEALQLFPNWIGFSIDRQSNSFATKLRSLRADGINQIDDAFQEGKNRNAGN